MAKVKVEATRLGYYDHTRRPEGSVFWIDEAGLKKDAKGKVILPAWVKPAAVEAEAPKESAAAAKTGEPVKAAKAAEAGKPAAPAENQGGESEKSKSVI
jgi:hypothetical protein